MNLITILKKFLFLRNFEPRDSYKKNSYKKNGVWEGLLEEKAVGILVELSALKLYEQSCFGMIPCRLILNAK